jgi:hypothetical protein
MASHRTIICGKGRLGQLISSTLDAKSIAHEFARIDATQGLVQNSAHVCGTLDALILCFAPKHEEDQSGWHGLLNGLLAQVQCKELSIQRLLFISSTSVYEAVERGFVDAGTPVTGASVRSQGLLDAENMIPQLSANSAIFRLTGLVGAGYNKYDPVTYSHGKPRQAVDTRAVAAKAGTWFAQQPTGHRIEVLTDGLVYWQGRKLDPVKDQAEIKKLSEQFRLLNPSKVCRQS